MTNHLEFRVVVGDVTAIRVDTLVLKYAQANYGVDASVTGALGRAGVDVRMVRPSVGKYALTPGRGVVGASNILFVGVTDLAHFRYSEIFDFTKDALDILSKEQPTAETIALTLHGVGFGLDEFASFQAELAGVQEAWRNGHAPSSLRSVVLVERNEKRCARLREALAEYVGQLPPSEALAGPNNSATFVRPDVQGSERRSISTAEREITRIASAKPHAFVAMPYSTEMEDLYRYGIQGPVNRNNLLCERVDHSVFTGDIVGYMQQRIQSASIMVAIMTGANPNVYLEVGYAWGKGVPSILAASSDQELAFDVKGHRCLMYKSIADLESQLDREIQQLRTSGRLGQKTVQ